MWYSRLPVSTLSSSIPHFEQSGIGTDAAFAQAALVGLINVLFTLVAIVLIDHGVGGPLMVDERHYCQYGSLPTVSPRL